MRQYEQTPEQHTEAVRSAPVPVPPPANPENRDGPWTGHDRDRDADDPDAVHDAEATHVIRPDQTDRDPDATTQLDRDDDATTRLDPDDDGRGPERPAEGTDPDLDERADGSAGTEYHEPANQPTAFGAGTVGGAAAAAALASGVPADERDARDDQTVRPGDGRATDGELLPGTVPSEPVGTLLSSEAAQGFRDRWRDVQLRFIDDPHAAAAEAQQLAEEAIDALTTALNRQKEDLNGWQRDQGDDTEQLRVVVRRYRDFIDRALGR